jgi:hypothetical protein
MAKKIWVFLAVVYFLIIIGIWGYTGFNPKEIAWIFPGVTLIFAVVVVLPVKFILIPKYKKGIQANKGLKEKILNKSDFAGINYLTTIFGFTIIPVLIYSGWEYASGNLLRAVAPIIGFFALAILLILSVNKLSFMRLKNFLDKKGEKITAQAFGSLKVKKTPNKNLEFSEVNLYFIDAIFALTNEKNLYIRPTVIYSKQTLLQIPEKSITSIESNVLRIKRSKVPAQINAEVTAKGLPLNEILEELDQFLPIEQLDIKIKTTEREYEILLPKKFIKFFKELVSLSKTM